MTETWCRQAGALAVIALAAGGMSGPARASGDNGPTDEFVTRWGPAGLTASYDAGQLGVVLPSFHRVYLYTAWRAIVLGAEGYKKAPTTAGGLARAEGSAVDGWVNLTDKQHPYTQWLKASEAAAPRKASVPSSDFVRLGPDYGGYINCPPAAFVFAKDMLQTVGQRADATPQRVANWVAAQDAVFAFCAYDPQKRPDGTRKPPPPLPTPLAANEAAYWRQLREYQIAAAHFYGASFAEAAQRFSAIGDTPEHPMRAWGAYLALRAHVRLATVGGPGVADAAVPPEQDRDAEAAKLIAEAQRILDDPGQSVVHEATRATVRTLQFRLTPRRRFGQLSDLLDDMATNPYLEDHLGDWRRLANGFIDDDAPTETREPIDGPMRQRHEYFDWMRTLQRCGLASDAKARAEQCRREASHALSRWKQLGGDKAPHAAGRRQAWLLAALALSDHLDPPLEKAALAVPATAPEYWSVRYQLTRLYRLAHQSERARELSQAVLAEMRRENLASASGANLFKQERFAQATSLKDAADHLMRSLAYTRAPDSGEAGPLEAVPSASRPAADGQTWLNTRLAVNDLLELARDERLGLALRKRVAVAAWMRADLLGSQEPAKAASLLVEALAPGLRTVAQQYRAITQPRERQHALIIAAMSLDLSPLITTADFSTDVWAAAAPAPDKSEVTASMWCSVAKNQRDVWQQPLEAREVEQAPPPPEVSGNAEVRDREMAALAQLKTATGFVGDHVLAWAKDHPNDPDVPWLLYVVVQSTRGGCLDPDASKTSKAAFQLLHRRYKNSEWAAKTPVWY